MPARARLRAVSPSSASRPPDRPIEDLVASLSREQLVEVVVAAVDRHDDVQRAVRLIAARADGDLSQLHAAIDGGLRTRRFLDYRGSITWAHAARPIIVELEAMAAESPSRELVELLQRAVGHIVKVILRADDSSGLIGDLARQLLDIHATACDAGVADPVKLAAWMIRFRFRDQDFFEVDPVRYASALGERGIAAYRKAVADADGDTDGEDSFAARYARERLAILDRDVDAIVEIAGGNLSNPAQYLRVAEAMAEIDRPDLVLTWTARAITNSDGWQLGSLYELACTTHAQLQHPIEVLRLRRAHHERMPSSSTYGALKRAAGALDAWERERDAARATLRATDPREYLHALLADGDDDLAWQTAAAAPAAALDADMWLALAERREATHPADAIAVYLRIADEVLITTDRRAYSRAIRILKRARTAAQSAGELNAFIAHIATLREEHRRRPTLIAMLDKAKLTGP